MTKASVEKSVESKRMVYGYPKTGRTWLRYMLANYMNDLYGLNLEIDLNNVYSLVPNDSAGVISGQPGFAYEGALPLIEMSHEPYEPAARRAAGLVFLARDPRDIMVSRWLHDKRQISVFDGNLSEFIRDESRGIEAFAAHLESWAPHLDSGQVVTYEFMRSDTVRGLSKVLTLLDLPVSDAVIRQAIKKSSMTAMRQQEIDRGIAGHAYDRTDPEALRVRRGKVGGYVDYLSAEDLDYIEKRLERLTKEAARIVCLTGHRPA